ncbi:hypothetical protein NC651_004636 [Populus alba x Populus x berolinensis]|nr:hypothetical protein NC651_004636 [Populus alba x Populus x berolinensis]
MLESFRRLFGCVRPVLEQDSWSLQHQSWIPCLYKRQLRCGRILLLHYKVLMSIDLASKLQGNEVNLNFLSLCFAGSTK